MKTIGSSSGSLHAGPSGILLHRVFKTGVVELVRFACRRFQGFGFVEFHNMRDAEDAQEELDNKLFGGRVLEVSPSLYLKYWHRTSD